MSSNVTVLFDIDGTLLRTGGAGMIAINQTFEEMFGIENKAKIEVHGRTDFGILGDLFRANGVDFEQHYQAFSKQYHQRLESLLPTTNGVLLPCVQSFLERLRQANFQLGILTGNALVAAQIKLSCFGIESFFAFGGYGDDSANRNDVASAAVESARSKLGNKFDLKKCWVIGDTPADVECARSVGSRAIAVMTGGYDYADFNDSKADLMIENLCELSCKELGET